MKDDTISRAAIVDAIEGVDWYHMTDSGEMVHGANSAEHQAWYKAEDIYAAIEALPSAQPVVISKSENTTECEDAVSKEAVSSWLKQYGQDVLHGKYKFSLMYIWKKLMDLPSVTPKQPGWIPVTERLPERYDNYLITTEDEGTDIGTFHPEFKQWSICDADGFRLTDGVLAWCELPKPWEGEKDDG